MVLITLKLRKIPMGPFEMKKIMSDFDKIQNMKSLRISHMKFETKYFSLIQWGDPLMISVCEILKP